MIADFDPYEGSLIDNFGLIKKIQFRHQGKWDKTGWIANEKEKDPDNYELIESTDEGSHSIMSFYSEFKNLQEGHYVYDEQSQQWILQNPNKK